IPNPPSPSSNRNPIPRRLRLIPTLNHHRRRPRTFTPSTSSRHRCRLETSAGQRRTPATELALGLSCCGRERTGLGTFGAGFDAGGDGVEAVVGTERAVGFWRGGGGGDIGGIWDAGSVGNAGGDGRAGR